jgi:hypothetical protein
MKQSPSTTHEDEHNASERTAPHLGKLSGLDRAIEDVRAGRVFRANNIDELLQSELGR